MPTPSEERELVRAAGAARWVFNHLLRYREDCWLAARSAGATGIATGLGYVHLSAVITALREERAWLARQPVVVLRGAAKAVDRAFQNFFEGRAGFPHPTSLRPGRPCLRREARGPPRPANCEVTGGLDAKSPPNPRTPFASHRQQIMRHFPRTSHPDRARVRRDGISLSWGIGGFCGASGRSRSAQKQTIIHHDRHEAMPHLEPAPGSEPACVFNCRTLQSAAPDGRGHDDGGRMGCSLP